MVLIIVRWPFWSFLGGLIFCDANFLGRLRPCLRCRCRCCSCLLSFLVCPSVHLVVASSCLKQSASETFSKTSASCEHERCVCIPLFLSPPFWCRVCCPFWLFASLSPDISTFDLPLSYDTNLEMVVTWLVCGSIVSFVEWVCMYLEDPVLSSLNEEDRLFDGLWRFRSMAWAAEDGSDLFCGFVCSPVFCCGRPCLWKTLSCSSEETDRLLTVSKHRKQKMEVINCFVSLFALVCLYLEDLLLLFTSKEEADRLGGFWSMGSRRWKWFVLWVFFALLFLVVEDLFLFICKKRQIDRLDGIEAWEAEDGSDMCIVSLFALLFVVVEDLFLFIWKKRQIGFWPFRSPSLGSRRWMDGSDMCIVGLFVLSFFVCARPFPVHLKEESDWLDGFEAWEAEDGSDMNCVSLFVCTLVCIRLIKRMVCRSANVVLWAGLLFF